MADEEDVHTPARTDDGDDNSSDSDNSGIEEEEEQTEWLATSRAKRSTAGNRLTSLIQQEAEDDDLELLFAEDEDDAGFEVDEDEGSDVQMDSSDDEDDQGPTAAGAEDLEGEKQLQQEARAERLAKKRKANEHLPKAFQVKKVKIDPTAPMKTPPRPKKKSERASWIPTAEDAPIRASDRRTTKKSKEQLYAQMVDREKRRLKQLENMEKAAKRKEAQRRPEKTQEDRLAEAARVEKMNARSLNRWEEAEKIREEEQRAKLAALHNRKLEGPVITWWSGMATWMGDKLKMAGRYVVEEEKEKPKKRKAAEMEDDAAIAAKQNPQLPGAQAAVASTQPAINGVASGSISTPSNPSSSLAATNTQPATNDVTSGSLSGPPNPSPSAAVDNAKPPNEIDPRPIPAPSNPSPSLAVDNQQPSTNGSGPGPISAPANPPSSLTTTPTTLAMPAGSVPLPSFSPAAAPAPAPPSLALPASSTPLSSASQPAPAPSDIPKTPALPATAPAPAPATAPPALAIHSSSTPLFSAPQPAPAPSDIPNTPAPPPPTPAAEVPLAIPTGNPEAALPTTSSEPSKFIPSPDEPFRLTTALPTTAPQPSQQPNSTSSSTLQPQIKPEPQPYPPLLLQPPQTPEILTDTSQPPPQSAPHTALILTSFSDVALRDKSLQTAILFHGHRFSKLPKPSPPTPCCITHLPARFRDPVTALPYCNAYAYKQIQRLRRGEYRYSGLLGAYVGGAVPARGVPERFAGMGGGGRGRAEGGKALGL